MVKRFTYLILMMIIASSSRGQELTNIFSEQDGDKIHIYYSIINAKEGQTFNISVSCATEQKRFILKSVSGDVGDSITPGTFKKITWDVLKDVDEINEAEFFVRIEKINEAFTVVKEEEKAEEKTLVVAEEKTLVVDEEMIQKSKSEVSSKNKFLLSFDGSYGAFGNSRGFGSGISFSGKLRKVNPYLNVNFFKYKTKIESLIINDIDLIGYSFSGGVNLKIQEKFYFYTSCGFSQFNGSIQGTFSLPGKVNGPFFKSGVYYIPKNIVVGFGVAFVKNEFDLFTSIVLSFGFTF